MTAQKGPAGSLPCWRVRWLLQSYLDGVLDDVATGRVARHLVRCHRCTLRAETYQAIKRSLAQGQRSSDATQRLRDFGDTLRDRPPCDQPAWDQSPQEPEE